MFQSFIIKIPMINNLEGKKLSKRDGAMDVMDYKRKDIYQKHF